MSVGFLFTLFFITLIYLIRKTFIIVPQQYCYIVERVGVFKGALEAGFHFYGPS